MTEAEQNEMERLREKLGTRFCRRCDYCQPCPEKIPISLVMVVTSFARRVPPATVFSGWIANGMERAANCTDCGECEEKCPYHLPIREMIAEQVKWYQSEKSKYQERRT